VTSPRRQRLDQLLVERGLVPSRSHAQALVLGGRVRVGIGDSARMDRKPGDLLAIETPVELVAQEPYVSRGGHKLAAALDAFAIDPSGRVCLDVGASTGGFTDVLLQRGARRVYAVDVGRGQLADPLRRDDRVVSMERTNARTLTPELLGEPVGIAVIDVSFISLDLILEPVGSCFSVEGGEVVALVKPQFEAGRGKTDRGVVRDPSVHRDVLAHTTGTALGLGLRPAGLVASPILGPAGNREFLLHLRVGQGADSPNGWDARIDEVVAG
jgi:23S rRNA (cytidine1920-2'-O)/16S rRNA (cytidine1409-2'-O)-methyltransferase